MEPLERDAAHLWDMLDAAGKAAELSAGIGLDQLLEDIRTRYAVERALEIVGEAARRVSQETRDTYPEIPWSGIIGFRNVLAHKLRCNRLPPAFYSAQRGGPETDCRPGRHARYDRMNNGGIRNLVAGPTERPRKRRLDKHQDSGSVLGLRYGVIDDPRSVSWTTAR